MVSVVMMRTGKSCYTLCRPKQLLIILASDFVKGVPLLNVSVRLLAKKPFVACASVVGIWL